MLPSSETVKIKVISLPGALERRRAMAIHLDAQQRNWAFFDACDGSSAEAPPYDEHRAAHVRGRTLLRGEIGCFQSHWTLWKQLIESNDEWWLILEDDHWLDPTFDLWKTTCLANDLNIHYIRLSYIYNQKFVLLGNFLGRQFLRYRSGPYGSGAYLLSRVGAQRLISSVPAIVRPIDDELDCFWLRELPAVALFPPPTLNLGFGSSTISAKESRRMDDGRTWQQMINWFLVRLNRKLRKEYSNIYLRQFDRNCRKRSEID